MEKEIKTLESQAYEYAYPAASTLYRQGFIKEEWLRDMLAQAYLAGHEAAIKNQWQDASKPPSLDNKVLVNCPDENDYALAYYYMEEWYMKENGELVKPTRWMPIPLNNETKEKQ